jgi:hypothetical protein
VPAPAEPEDDLLVLTAEDLWPEAAPAELAPVPAVTTTEVHLELEELDLEGLQDLAPAPAPTLAPVPVPELPAAPLAVPPIYTHELPPLETEAPAEALAEESLSFSGLDAFEGLGADLALPPVPEPPKPEPSPVKAEEHAGLPLVGGALAAAGLAAAAVPFMGASQGHPAHELPAPELPVPEFPALALPVPAPVHEPVEAVPAAPPVVPEPIALTPAVEALPAAPGHAPAASGQAAPLAPAQVQALLADPALMDALVKAVVARMGDQVVREIAWEIMPELAGKLQK